MAEKVSRIAGSSSMNIIFPDAVSRDFFSLFRASIPGPVSLISSLRYLSGEQFIQNDPIFLAVTASTGNFYRLHIEMDLC